MTIRRTSPPRTNSVPSDESESIVSVNPGSRPHHCRTSSVAAAVQRVWPHTTWTSSPGSHVVGDRLARAA